MDELTIINKSVEKTYEWLKTINKYAGWDSYPQSLAALRVTLHQLRDNIPLENAVYLSAQMPIFIRGLFFENWHPLCTPLKERKEQVFMSSIKEHLDIFGGTAENIDPLVAVKAVFKTLSEKISEGEIQKIIHLLPKQLRCLWHEDEL